MPDLATPDSVTPDLVMPDLATPDLAPPAWTTVGTAVNAGPGAQAHALGSDGTSAFVAWVSDESQTSKVYVHKYDNGAWAQLGASLDTGSWVQAVVDLQFDQTTPNVLFADNAWPTGAHVQSFDGANWNEVGSPGLQPGCSALSTVGLALHGAAPHVTYTGSGGCGYSAGYGYWTGASWWQEPMPPTFGNGIITASFQASGNSAVAWDGTRALVAVEEQGLRYVKYWDGLAWANLGGTLNVNGVGTQSWVDQFLSLTVDGSGTPYVAWAESSAGLSYAIFVKRYDPNTGWVLLGADQVSGAGDADFPSIAIIGGAPHVAYVEANGGITEVRVQRYVGGAWSHVGSALNNDLSSSATRPDLIGVGGVPHVAFREPSTGIGRIYVRRYQ